MSDELAVFFAKKASKGKKKGVIKLQEVADQLEKRAKIQDEIDEMETKASEEAISKPRNSTENEDSEWLEFDERPILPSAVKEMEDFDIESEEEEKRSSAEPTKTWNVNNNSESNEATPPPVIAPKESVYVPKAMARATRNQFDINNEMLFPTLGNASNVEKELKKEEEENIRQELEDKRKKEEEQRRIEEARAKRYNAPRGQGQQDGETQRRMERKQQQESAGPTESDTSECWRREANQQQGQGNEEEGGGSPQKQPERRHFNKEPTAPTDSDTADWRRGDNKPIEVQPEKKSFEGGKRGGQEQGGGGATEADSVDNWRGERDPHQDGGSPRKQQPEKRQTETPPAPTQSETAQNWRSAKSTTSTPKAEPEIAQQQTVESNKPADGGKKAYIPPHLRNK